MNFDLKCAFRFAFSKSGGRRTSTIIIILSIALGLVALIVVSSVMNGLQTVQLDKMRSVESFDIILENTSLTIEQLNSISEIDFAFEFLETSVIVENKEQGLSDTLRLRGFDYSLLENPRFSQCLSFNSDQYTFEKGLTLSLSTMSELGLKRGKTVEVTFLRKGKQATVIPYKETMVISSTYASSLPDFSSSTIISDLDLIQEILNTQTKIGIFCNSNAAKVKNIIKTLDSNAVVTIWQDYNKALYSALLLEKTVMYIFLFLIFVIVCVGLRNSTGRLINAKMAENGILMALGATKREVVKIYIIQTSIISVCGIILGLILGLIVSENLNSILSFADFIIFVFSGSRTILTYMSFESYVSVSEMIVMGALIFVLSHVFTLSVASKAADRQVLEVVSDVAS